MFFNLVYSQTEKEIKQKFSLHRFNKIFSFDYSITENNPKLFDVVEYQFNFHTCMTTEKIKIKSINFIFNNAERNKVNFFNFMIRLFSRVIMKFLKRKI